MIISVEALCKKDIKGKTIVFKTDTVYGIGALYNDEKAIKKIYMTKGRDANKPLAILCGSLDDALRFTSDETLLKPLALKYWPGALTLVVPKTDIVPPYVNAGFDTIGLRMPNDTLALKLLNHFGPMAVTSLNRSNEPEIKTYQNALEFNDKADYIVVGDDAEGKASTVYDVMQKRILRQGDIKLD